ncbi:dehydrase and lipid transport-domain-containing protein [Geranomyces variabilis]|nr:dehydrase and lipid transport-domain-containing protein [Geranomyces variabilis]KAJ3141023.1 hypothetical protein HDU90_007046 [Geranomyces variabilis]
MPPRPFAVLARRLPPRPDTIRHYAPPPPTLTSARATFFSLPNLPDILLPSTSTTAALLRKEHSQRHTLPYSPRQLYAVVADVEQYHRFVPWCTRSKVLERNYHQRENAREMIMRAELGIGFRALSEHYVSRVVGVEGVSVTALAQDSSVFKELNTTWRFSPAGTDSTISSRLRQPSSISTTANHPATSLSPSTAHTSPLDSPSCVVDFHILFEFRSPLYAHVSTLFFEEVSKAMMGAFEDRARVVYGPPAIAARTPTTRA